MSDFGLFEADLDAEQEPRRRERIAARQMTSALQEVHRRFEGYVANADGADNFEDRFGSIRREVANTMIAHGVGAYPAVMREAHGSLKSAWYNRYSAADGFVDPDSDDDSTINKKQKSKIDKGEKPGKDDVKSNSGDGSDAQGNFGGKKAKPFGKDSRLRVAGSDDGPFEDGEYLRHAPAQQLQEGRDHSEADLIPQRDNHPENAETSGVQRDFTPGGDTGSDRREAMQLVADIYNDWAQGNRLRVASMNTLDLYASRGLHDNDYYVLASLIRQAEDDCECDDEDDDDDSESGPPQDSGDSESDDSGDDSDGDDDSESSGDNPFAGDDSSDDSGEPADDGDDSDFGDGDDASAGAGDDFGGGDPAEDGGDQDFPADPAPEDSDPNAAGPGDDVGGDPSQDQSFQVPDQAPDLPGDEMSQLQQGGPDSVPPEVIDDILGLPPGTLEALITEELQNAQGGGGAPPGPPQGGPPPQLASRSRRPFAKGTQPRASRSGYRVAADEDPAAAGAPAAPAAPAQMPAAPPAGSGSAGTMPPPGAAGVAPPPAPMPLENQPAEDALLDTALQAITQMVDRETQEYQQVIDPLNQALQAVQFAQQVEQAENPLDVTPPEGTVDADPSAAPGGADSLQQQASRIASRYDLSENGYSMLMTAMSRKHYEHVAEAIRTLPGHLREGIAHQIGGMFSDDNPRFNHDIWMNSVGDPRVARRQAGWEEELMGEPGYDPADEPYGEHAVNGENGVYGDPYGGAGGGSPQHYTPSHAAPHPHDKWKQISGPNTPAPNIIERIQRGGSRSRRPFVGGENNKNTQLLDTFEFPGQGDQASSPQISDNIGAGALPKPPKGMKPLTSSRRQATTVVDKFQKYKTKEQGEGLGYGGDTTVDNFFNGPGAGYKDRARSQVHEMEGIEPHPKTASFFTRRVPGWKWDDHLAGYISKEASAFTCECGHKIATPGYGNCRCGKLWYTYAIGDGNHLASNTADMYITREIPVRDDVIMANKKMQAWTSDNGWTPPDQRDVDWVEDEDREDADAPHAPGKNAMVALAWDAARVAASNMIGEPVGRQDDPSFQGVVSGPGSTPEHVMVQHPGGEHEMSIHDLGSSGTPAPAAPSLKDRVREHIRQRVERGAGGSGMNGGFAGGRSAKVDDDDYIVKYDDDEDPARSNGPKKPPSTKVKGGDPKWHSRQDGGKFKSTNPFGG